MALAWIIDDGFKSRTHRKNIFNSMHNEVSIVAGPHSSAQFCYIAVFAHSASKKDTLKKVS